MALARTDFDILERFEFDISSFSGPFLHTEIHESDDKIM